MRRLRDEIDSPDPALLRAAQLLSLASPLDAGRFWNLQPVRATRRRRALSFRMVTVVAMSLASFAASAEVLPHLHMWNAPWAATRAVTGPPSAAPVAAAPKPAPGPELARAPLAIPDLSDDARGPALPPPSAAKAPNRPLLAPLRVASVASAAPPKTASNDSAQPDTESSLILDAVRALRRDRDPARALSLAEVAMDQYPQGAQVEEATALGMEAASAAGDDAMARRLAERYLASFRTGHFADRAQQIVSAPLR